jgi:hypothetical protein
MGWNDTDNDEELDEQDTNVQAINCSECEAEYYIGLDEDFLFEKAIYCCFCGELLERE